MKKLFILTAHTTALLFAAEPVKAPNWTLQNTDGVFISLRDLRGKIVVMDFWAIWCSTCKPELKELAQLQEELGAEKVVVVGIGVDSGDLDFLGRFKDMLNLNFDLLTGNRSTVKQILRDYGNIRRIPTLIIIDRKGNIAHRITGFKGKDELSRLISSL